MKAKLLAVFFSLVLITGLYSEDLRGDTIAIQSYQIKLDLSDSASKILHGDALIGIQAKVNGLNAIHLDLLELTVDSVKVAAVNTPFAYNDSVVDIDFPAVYIGEHLNVEVFYHGSPHQPAGDFGGFFWNGATAFNIGVSFLADPPNYGKVWFPCFDNFSTRSTYEYFITTTATTKAFCNGLLLDSSSTGTTNTWHWKLAENIPSYLASVTVGPYVTLNDTLNGMNGNIPLEIAADAADTAEVNHFFQHIHQDFHNLEKHWGPYRWERAGYCIVPFDYGAMEHATNISFMQFYLNLAASSCEETAAHELSHHWFGDLVTCDSAAEMWLNEGWASYNQYLFFEDIYGHDSATKVQRVNHQTVLQMAQVKDGDYYPVASVPKKNTYGTTVYDKGRDVIHTLRYYMGDSLFFSSLKSYLNYYAFQTGSTAKMRDYLTQVSGMDLSDYFNDWVQSPGFPHFSIEHKEIAAANSNFNIRFQIRQRISHAPHLYNNVPVKVSYFDKDMSRTVETVMVSGECTDHASTLSFQPVYVAVDFDENLADAISDEWQMIKAPGNYNYSIGMMDVHALSQSDSVLLRIEHNWIPADAMYNPIPDLHLNTYRYWTVDGVFDSTFNAWATINYDGSPGSYLDSNFISNSEDSLVLMYRADQDSDWIFADSFFVNVIGNHHNARGQINIYKLKKGEYALGIYNTNLPTDINKRSSCALRSDISELPPHQADFKLYPNPANETVNISFEKNIFEKVEIFDLPGRKVMELKITPEQSSMELKLNHLAGGSYLVSLSGKSGNRSSKKMIKQ